MTNPYRLITVEGDARTWHTPILSAAVETAIASGIAEKRLGGMLRCRGSQFQLDLQVAVHPGGPADERKSSLWSVIRHRYHDHEDRISDRMLKTQYAIERWSFNEQRISDLGGLRVNCDNPHTRWAIHSPLVARRYREWRKLDLESFLYNSDRAEGFTINRAGDAISYFGCSLGSAVINSTWSSTDIGLPFIIPHTMDASIIGMPVVHIVEHPVLDHPSLIITEVKRNSERTRLVLGDRWTTIGDRP